ncbi:UDP-glucose 4-epimerase GalE [Nocardia cyriacigeorgica]|uniref:UDP-glucose 4-epimerase GalE n=1 Tax=Nocardia cyriacigeorgica TaxID=135487 RepID=UPI001895215E|nr:UDP-glucose 4-epimerase GalE [Nocardia cyriacigeorgica]MBF6399475.1 UDP-glucose 4-epimerase GalE [Nocardia cyriacigeorgica]MBF6405105.1 UDP-glucose 4-epimerase GalE [Nocardia cyriacigeorgica]
MKLLVTGGAGYIGSVVAHQLVDAGHQVEIIDDLSTGHEANLPAAATFHRMSIHQAADILTPDAEFDGVLHFAASIEVAESVANPDKYWHNNIEGSLALLRAIRAANVPRLIFSSTGSMYTGDGETAFDETAEVRPQNPYAASKATVDQLIAGECGASTTLAAASLRYFNAAGAVLTADGVHLGERHDPESHLIPILLQAAGGQRPEFTLFGTDYETRDGTCIRDYIHVSDLAAAHLLALDAVQPGRHDIYNLGNGEGFTNREVLDTVREVTGSDFPVRLEGRRPGDPAICIASSERAHRELGWKPQHTDLTDIIESAWQFHQVQQT